MTDPLVKERHVPALEHSFVGWLYRLTFRGDRISRIVAPVLFHWYCPYPLSTDWTARACNKNGTCACNNRSRYEH